MTRDNMKIHNLLFIACLASVGFVILANAPVVAQASSKHHASPIERPHKKPPVYIMVRRSIVGADDTPGERVWDIQLAPMLPAQVNVNPPPPDSLFESLDAPSLLIWVSNLPPKSYISVGIFTGPREKFGGPSRSGEVPAKLQQEIDAFTQFCAKHNVEVGEAISSG